LGYTRVAEESIRVPFQEFLEVDFRGCSRVFRGGSWRFLVEKMKGNNMKNQENYTGTNPKTYKKS
jgi:hypothetical protein